MRLLLCFLLLSPTVVQADKAERSLALTEEGVAAANEGRLASAEESLRAATEVDPRNHKAFFNLGQLHAMQQKWSEAVGAFSRAAGLAPIEVMYHYHHGRALFEDKSLGQSKAALERALAQNDRLFKAHYYLGRIYSDQGELEKAARSFTRSCRLNPTFGPSFVSLGRLYLSWDYQSEAKEVFLAGTTFVKEPKALAKLFFHLGVIADREGRWGDAVARYTSVLQTRPDHMTALLQRGFSYAKQGDKRKAIDDLQKFVQQGGDGSPFNLQAANELLMRLSAR